MLRRHILRPDKQKVASQSQERGAQSTPYQHRLIRHTRLRSSRIVEQRRSQQSGFNGAQAGIDGSPYSICVRAVGVC